MLAVTVLLPSSDLPEDFVYPAEFVRVVECGLINLEPWHVLTGDELFRRFRGLRLRYPARQLIPFAARQDNDDIACWDMSRQNEVAIVHDFASSGWEDQGSYDDFNSWLRSAFDEFIEWM